MNKKLYPYSKENERDNTICSRCGSRDKDGFLKTERNQTFGEFGKGLCDECLKKSNQPSDKEIEGFTLDYKKDKIIIDRIKVGK